MGELIDFFRKLFDYSDWPPRWHCGKWTEFHGWLYIISDLLIWSAYFAIPLIIIRYISRKFDTRFIRLYFLFAAFILSCGATHFLDALAFWMPLYRLNALVRLITGVISWITVFYLIKSLPAAFSLRTQAELEWEITQRKKAEEQVALLHAADKALTESEKKYRALFENSPLPMWVLDLATYRFLDVNETAIAQYGYSREEFLSMTAFDIRSIEEQERYRKLSSPPPGTRNTGVWKHIKKDGTVIDAEVSAHITMYDDKAARLILSVDVTDRIKAQEELEKNELRYRNTLDKMLEGVQIIGFDWKYIYVNDAMARHGKYSREEFIGHTVMEKYPGIEQTDIYQVYKQCFDERISIHLENKFTFPDGSKGWFELSFQPIPEGLFILSVDITERRRSEEEVLALNKDIAISERIYRTIASSIPRSVISILDTDHRYTLIEGDMLEQLGYSKKELLGNKMQDVVGPEKYAEMLPKLKRVFAGETFTVEDIREKYDTVSRFVPLKNHAGEVSAAMVFVFDVSELKEAQRAVAELNHNLEEKITARTIQLASANKELESFSYSVSHDLRAPLRGIDGWSLALLEDYGDVLDEKALTYLGRVRTETQRMGELIDDLLKLSSVSRVEIRLEKIDLSSVAETIIRRLQEEDPLHQVAVHIQQGLICTGDANLIEIMLTNLLGNAFKFTGKTADAQIQFGETEIDGKKTYFIKDNGAGFNMEQAKNLFGAFQRMHRQSEFAGTGIGLATVQRIIHLHFGTVWAEAVVNQGATFYFTIPK